MKNGLKPPNFRVRDAVKGQQIFHSFLPGVTAAVLTTQPTWAETTKFSGVQQVVPPNVSTSTIGGGSLATNTNNFQTQQPSVSGNDLSAITAATAQNTVNMQPVINNEVEVIATTKTGIPIEQISGKDRGAIFSLSSISSSKHQPGQNFAAMSKQKQSNLAIAFNVSEVNSQPIGGSESASSDPTSHAKLASTPKRPAKKSIKIPVPQVGQNTDPVSKTVAKDNGERLRDAIARMRSHNQVTPSAIATAEFVQEKSLSTSAFQQSAAQNKNAEPKLSASLQNTAKGSGAAKLLGVQQCTSQQISILTSPTCTQQKYSIRELVAQAGSPTPPTPTPPLITPPIPIPPTTPAAPQAPEQIPDYLNPNANPLQFPTRPEEVRTVGTQPITLEQAIELARRNNRELQVSLLELERAQAALREAQAALYPNLNLNAQIARQQSASSQLQSERQSRAEVGVPPELRTPSSDSPTSAFTGEAQLTYNLYTSGRRQASINAAEEQVRFQELDVERLSEQIRLNVATEYYDLQQADENVRITQSAVTNAEASLRDAQALERAGVGTRFDVLRAQVNLANAQQDLTEALSQQRITRSRLATRLSIPTSITISAADPVKLSGLWNPTLEESIVLAFQNRPELQQFLAQRNISEQRGRQALAQLGPQLSLVASYNLLDQFDDSFNVTDGYSVGLQASLNLFDGGAARARAAQERINARIAETQFAQQRDQISFEVEQAYSNLQSNLEQVQTANAALEQAREALRLARLRFQAGVGTQTDVIAAENDLTRAEGNRINAILNYNRALANLQRSVTTRGLR